VAIIWVNSIDHVNPSLKISLAGSDCYLQPINVALTPTSYLGANFSLMSLHIGSCWVGRVWIPLLMPRRRRSRRTTGGL